MSDTSSTLPPFDGRPLLLADLEPVLALVASELRVGRVWVVAGREDLEALGLASGERFEVGPGAFVVAAGPVAESLRAAAAEGDGPTWTSDGRLLLPVQGGGGLVTGPAGQRTPEGTALVGALAQVACAIVSRAAQLARAQEQIRELAMLSTVDPLTGLRNRRYLDRKFQSELGRRRRYQRPLALLLLDLDHFKQLNDTRGHEVGDAVLREVACVLRESLRVSDIAVRFGGEEFAALLPETSFEGAIHVAERVRRAVAAREAQGVHVTVSVGVAAVDGAWDGDAAALLRAADQALYRAKRDGRDRVVHVNLGDGTDRK